MLSANKGGNSDGKKVDGAKEKENKSDKKRKALATTVEEKSFDEMLEALKEVLTTLFSSSFIHSTCTVYLIVWLLANRQEGRMAGSL